MNYRVKYARCDIFRCKYVANWLNKVDLYSFDLIWAWTCVSMCKHSHTQLRFISYVHLQFLHRFLLRVFCFDYYFWSVFFPTWWLKKCPSEFTLFGKSHCPWKYANFITNLFWFVPVKVPSDCFHINQDFFLVVTMETLRIFRGFKAQLECGWAFLISEAKYFRARLFFM